MDTVKNIRASLAGTTATITWDATPGAMRYGVKILGTVEIRQTKTNSITWTNVRPGPVVFTVRAVSSTEEKSAWESSNMLTAPQPKPANPLPIQSVEYWKSRFDSLASSFHSENNSLSLSGDEWDIYDLAYGFDGYLAMYEATGDKAYIDRCISYANNCISTAKPAYSISSSQFDDDYLTWVNYTHPGGATVGDEFPLFESYGWRYVCRLLFVIKTTPALWFDPVYKNHYTKILAFTERNIFDKWVSRGSSNIQRQNTHMASHWAMISMYLYHCTNDAVRKAKAKEIRDAFDFAGLTKYNGANLRKQLINDPYFWNANWNSYSRPGQDVAHGNAVLAYVTSSAAIGGYWNLDDMKKFGGTMRKCQPKYAYVDGTGSGTGWFADGFVKVGQFGYDLQRALETHGVTGQAQYRAWMALNAKRLTA